MSTLVGYYSLFFGLIISLFINFYSFYNYKKKIFIFEKILSFISIQLLFVILSFISLIYSFIISDFSNKTVYNNSHYTKPIFYKISGTWGNHEGSLLLWLLVLTVFVFIFAITSKKFSNHFRLLTIFFQQIIISGFFLFILFTSNPFEHLYPTPTEGLGLNPILQDPILAIHPPILYVGYVGTSIIFSLSLAAIVKKNITKEWAQYTKKWIIISWIFLTIGILLGSIWAYYELGWGGFWFWDPVENVSLMPWFCLTALLHTIIVLEKRLILKSWTIILSISTFALSMMGTFLVRSGILNSIHTFANDPTRGVFILIFLFLLITIALFIYFIYSEKEKIAINNIFIINKETSILINNWFMMYFLSVVLIGTIYPIFLEVINNHKISVGPPFYQKLIAPFLIVFLFFMSFETKLKWVKTDIKKINIKQIFIFILSLFISYALIKISGSKFLLATILLTSAILLLLVTTNEIYNNRSSISQKISHFGFGLLIISIVLNGVYSRELSYNMKVGDEVNFLNNSIKFKSLNTSEKNNYKLLKAEFLLINKDKKILKFNPEIRIYNQPNVLTSEADIITNFFTDNFLVFNLLNEDDFFNVRYQYKPLMMWIWISVILIAIGGLFSFKKKLI
tara:strand:+ start:1290 stop:3161 length:1872 start_codon:yes stop_codon:yes gene_type:complete